MILAERTSSNQQETSFSEAPGTSTDKNAVVLAEDSNTNEPESSQNQVAVTSPNIIVRQLSESFDDWSSSSESDISQGRLVERTPNGVYQQNNQVVVVDCDDGDTSWSSYNDEDEKKKKSLVQRLPPTTIENKVTASEKTKITTEVKTEYRAASLNVIHNHYYGSSSARADYLNRIEPVPAEKMTIDKDPNANVELELSDKSSHPLCTADEDAKCCNKKRLITISGAVLTGLAVIGVLIYFLIPGPKNQLIPVMSISSTTMDDGNSLSTTNLTPTSKPTISSAQDIHVSTESLLNEPTAIISDDYSHNTEKKNETNEISGVNNPLNIVTRDEWDAAPPLKPPVKLKVLPAARVIISETSTESCDETEKCRKLIRKIQRMYSNPISSPDIAYNFLVGGDGLIYQGRGWDIKGNVAAYFDHESINIAFIGNFSTFTPPEKQVQVALKLIRFGVDNYHISMFFKLSGKKQLTYMNENPGDKLYNIITKWQQWEPGIIGIDFHNKASDDEYNQTMAYLNLFSGTKFKYNPKRG